MLNLKRVLLGAVGVAGVIGVMVIPEARGAHEIVIQNGTFNPSEEYVGKGDSVIWVHNDGDKPYSVTADGGAFDSHPNCADAAPDQCLRAGQTFSWKAAKVGRYPYYSRVGGGPGGQGVHGTLIVVEKGSGEGTSTTR